MIDVAVMYPNIDGARFDEEYYINTHMPLVKEVWGPMGLKHAEVVRGVGGGDAAQGAPYIIIARLKFESAEAFEKAAHEAQRLFADLPNFTDIEPQVQVGEVIY